MQKLNFFGYLQYIGSSGTRFDIGNYSASMKVKTFKTLLLMWPVG